MASPRVGSLPAKMSFAKIAAMPPPQVAKEAHNSQQDLSPRNKERKPSNNTPLTSPQQPTALALLGNGKTLEEHEIEQLSGAIEGLALVKNDSLKREAAKALNNRVAAGPDSTEDDLSHLSNDSSREPPSFDTKSIASVTTFGMDEKESLRPDDSASVQAIDDEDSSSGPSCEPSIQGEGDASNQPRNLLVANFAGAGNVARRFPTITLANPPRFGDLPMSPITEAEESRQARGLPQTFEDNNVPILRTGALEMRPQLLAVVPDEKLLDALASVKDRLPLLQLEEKILGFVSNTNGPDYLDLPPQNSFGRLLAHKLADYYSLQHYISDDNNSVRLFRFRGMVYSLPTPLATIAGSIPTGPPPPPGSAAFKIMRRNGLGGRNNSVGGSTAASSSAPSKATSEAGGDGSDEGLMSPIDGTPQKDKSKLTREEREANYKIARERIFAGFQESVPSEGASTTGDTSASISRSSSSSGKRMKKQRKPKDDSFEARSSFTPSYAAMPIVGQQSPYQSSYVEPPFPMQYPNGSNNMPMNYASTPTQNYAGYESHMQYPSMPQLHHSQSVQPGYHTSEPWSNPQPMQPSGFYGYPPNQSPSAYPSQMSHMQQHGMNQYPQSTNGPVPQIPPNWAQQNQYPGSFQQTPTLQNAQPAQWPYPTASSPSPHQHQYPYGQIPHQPYPNPAYNPHPVPGSYNRPAAQSLFNPNSRSFVPSNTTSRSGGRNNNRKKPNSNTNSNTNSSGSNQPKMRANANSSEHQSITGLIPQRPSHPASSNSSSPRPKEDIPLQQKYGAPALLPKKPPPSQMPLQFEMEAQGFPLINSGGGPMAVNGGGGESMA